MSDAKIPWAFREKSLCWIKPASAIPPATAVPCAPQYCNSIERAAEPQPSSVCFTKGTSSHTPALFWGAAGTAHTRKRINKDPKTRCLMRVERSLLLQESANGERNDENRDDD